MRYDELILDLESGLGPMPPLTGPSPSPIFIILKDANSVLWNVSIDDLGSVHTVVVASGTPDTIILSRVTMPNTSWLIGIDISGNLIFSQTFPLVNNFPSIFPMATTGSLLQSGLTING